MIKKIKTYILIATMAFIPAVPMMAPVLAHADPATKACNSIAGGIRDGVDKATTTGAGTPANTECATSAFGTNGLAGVASNIVNIFSMVVGAVSVIMIIYGGFRYVTSGGDSNRVGAAKNTLIYAIIGLIIVALAQVIVHFVLAQSNNLGA